MKRTLVELKKISNTLEGKGNLVVAKKMANGIYAIRYCRFDEASYYTKRHFLVFWIDEIKLI